MTDSLPDEDPRTALDVLMDVLDLIAVVERKQPAYRAIPTKDLRALITSGWSE